MNVLYNSRNYCIAEFPCGGGIELMDKLSGRSAFLDGDLADSFRRSLASAICADASDDSLDEFLGGYDALMTQPVLLH